MGLFEKFQEVSGNLLSVDEGPKLAMLRRGLLRVAPRQQHVVFQGKFKYPEHGMLERRRASDVKVTNAFNGIIGPRAKIEQIQATGDLHSKTPSAILFKASTQYLQTSKRY